jgi:hypothetical protein
MAGFIRSALDPAEDWEKVEKYNAGLDQLIARRKSEVAVVGPFVESKTAWKCAVLQQALLYRLTMLASGCSNEWNAGNVLASILCGRAIIETLCLASFIADEIERFCGVNDIEGIEKLANEHLFATRDAEMIAGRTGFQAKNILTFIDKFDKKMPNVREAYDFLSEFCHPNASGLLMTYGVINKQTGTVTFAEFTPRLRYAEKYVITCFMLVLFGEPIMNTFDHFIPTVAKIDPNEGPWMDEAGGLRHL